MHPVPVRLHSLGLQDPHPKTWRDLPVPLVALLHRVAQNQVHLGCLNLREHLVLAPIKIHNPELVPLLKTWLNLQALQSMPLVALLCRAVQDQVLRECPNRREHLVQHPDRLHNREHPDPRLKTWQDQPVHLPELQSAPLHRVVQNPQHR